MSITTLITQFIEVLSTQTNRGIYVWGGNGEDLRSMDAPKDWIKRHETSTAIARLAFAVLVSCRFIQSFGASIDLRSSPSPPHT